MIKNIGKELWNRRKNKQAYPCYLLFAFSVYFLFSYFLPFSYSYGKVHLQVISGFSMFAFRQAEGYLARTANRRLVSYVAAGLILFVSVLAVLSKIEIKKRANILLVLLFLVLIAGQIGRITERNAFGNTNVYPHFNRIIQIILSSLVFVSYLVWVILLKKGRKE